jgi:hypothetical protein
MVAWFYMNEMVRDGTTKVTDFRDTVLSNIATEVQDTIYDFQLKFISTATGAWLPSSQRAAARLPVY